MKTRGPLRALLAGGDRPLLTWTPRERARVVTILRENIDHPQKFVRAWALDSLALPAKDRALLPVVNRAVAEFERSGSKALAVRARDIRARLANQS